MQNQLMFINRASFNNLERGDDIDNQLEGNLQMLHTGGSGYRRRGHAIHEQADEKAMQ